MGLDRFRRVLEAEIVFLKRLSFCSIFLPPRPTQNFLDPNFLIFEKAGLDINEAADSTINQILKNAARWWSSFICSLLVALFRDVPENYCDVRATSP